MNKFMSSWLQFKSWQRTFIIAFALAIAIGGLAIFRYINAKQVIGLMINNPEPLPSYILSVEPLPGTNSQSDGSKICVDLNTRQPPLGPVSDSDWQFLAENTSIQIDGVEYYIYAPMTYGSPYDIHLCWDGHFSGEHLAEVFIHTKTLGILGYRWAFKTR